MENKKGKASNPEQNALKDSEKDQLEKEKDEAKERRELLEKLFKQRLFGC
jgi:hypothetical protein